MNPYAKFLKREECLLLLVDIQKVMLDPCPGSEHLSANVAALVDVVQLLGIPILVSVHNAEKLGGLLPGLEMRVRAPRVFNKLEFSCFADEPLAREIAAEGRSTLILAGLEAHVCIFHTGAHALRLGYCVHVAADAVGARSFQNRETGLRRLEKAGAVISSTEMVIYELLGRAGTDEFRTALPILKKL
jgi:nicotinamidase-related amidase